MSDEQIDETPNATPKAAPAQSDSNWRERLKQLGKRGFEMAEMERLGFWPPNAETAQRTATLKAELQQVQEGLSPLRKRERELQAEIAKSGDVAALLVEVRRKRIERVKAERAARKQRRAQERETRLAQDKVWRAQTLPHLGREVSRGLRYEGGDEEKLKALGLPLLHTAEELAQAMDITTGRLAWLCYHRGAASIDHYHHFTIPKKSGGRRAISSPKSGLREAQTWLLSKVLSRLPVHEAAMAFRPGLHIGDNAQRHAHVPNGASVVLRIDLKDFFPSINFRRVKWLFQNTGYNEGIATLFALISTEAPRTPLTLDGKTHFVALTERFLPQGACTSPAITNALCRQLDARLMGAAKRCGFIYTRYADDLVFSSSEDKAKVLWLRDLAIRIIVDEKFEVNDDKTAIMRRHRRQTVTGLVINAKSAGPNSQTDSEDAPPGIPHNEIEGTPRLSRRDFRRFRAFLHRYETLGREAVTEQMGQDALSYARGYLSFIHMVSPTQEAKIKAAHPWIEPYAIQKQSEKAPEF